MKGRYHKEKQNNMFIREELNITPEEEKFMFDTLLKNSKKIFEQNYRQKLSEIFEKIMKRDYSNINDVNLLYQQTLTKEEIKTLLQQYREEKHYNMGELKPKNVPELCDELNMLLDQISTKTTDLGISLVPRFPVSTGSSGIGMPSTSLTRCLEFMVNISNNINNNLSIILESVK